MADRVGVIAKGELILVEDKDALMRKLGKKKLVLDLHDRLDSLPPSLRPLAVELEGDGTKLVFTYDTQAERTGITALLTLLREAQITFRDLTTTQSSLEDIFVDLVRASK